MTTIYSETTTDDDSPLMTNDDSDSINPVLLSLFVIIPILFGMGLIAGIFLLLRQRRLRSTDNKNENTAERKEIDDKEGSYAEMDTEWENAGYTSNVKVDEKKYEVSSEYMKISKTTESIQTA